MQTRQFIDLPTREFYDQIVRSVDTNQVTIVTAETGAGKSTQIPQYLAEHGYTKVIVTQPRILAARNLAYRVRDEWAERNIEDSTDAVGYRTAHERDDSGRTKILYCTDGLQLVRELTGSGTHNQQVLVLDEVHEWNENMEVLVAWAKRRVQEDPTFKVVIMSATLDEQSLAEYFDTTAVIKIPGRHYEVKKRSGSDVLSELFTQLDAPGHNILTFLPGKTEIQDTADALAEKAKQAGVPIIPLHSQLESEMQQRAFASYPHGKIILATNIAQTSITIDDIDLVIDSGLERHTEVRSGVEGLFIAQIAQADCLQRAGRAGRTKPGEYILAPYDTMPCLPFEERLPYAVPEIMRTHIDRLTLRLANIGIDIASLDFYHDPSHAAIQQAKHTLSMLGALTHAGDITRIGREMERFPVESSYARMLVEVRQYEPPIQSKLAVIIAIQEVGGIVRGGANHIGWQVFTKQRQSDLLAQYDVLAAMPTILPDRYETLGIIGKNVDKAEEVIDRLHHDLGLERYELTPILPEEATLLMRAIVAGQTHQLWAATDRGMYQHIQTGKERELSSSSVVRGAKLVAATPFDLQVPTRSGELETLHLIQGVTAVDTAWLLELAPERFAPRKTDLIYDPRLGGLARQRRVRFGKVILEGVTEPVLEASPELHRQFRELFSEWAYSRVEHELKALARYNQRVPLVTRSQVRHYVLAHIPAITNIAQLDSRDKKQLLAAANPETYLGSDFRTNLEYRGRPDSARQKREKYSKRRRGWLPRHQRRHD